MGDIDLKEVRQLIRSQRKAIPEQNRRLFSQMAAHYALQYIMQHDHKKIGVFLSLDEEIDTNPLIQTLWQDNYQLFLPVVVGKNEKLHWKSYLPDTQLQKGFFGTLEPVSEEMERIVPDLIVTPLVAYNEKGYRMGMGGGFYDRSFASKVKNKLPLLLGFAYSLQKYDKLRKQPWDICLDALANEKNLIFFN